MKLTKKLLAILLAFTNGALADEATHFAEHVEDDDEKLGEAFTNGALADEATHFAEHVEDDDEKLGEAKPAEEEEDDESKPPKERLVLEHRIGDKTYPRGELLVFTNGRARIEDAKEFVSFREKGELSTAIDKLAEDGGFYKVILTKKDGVKLESSIPASSLQNFEGKHDTLEIVITEHGIVGVNFSVAETWGLEAFEHTAVKLNQEHWTAEPKVPPKVEQDRAKAEQDGSGGLMGMARKYWWVILIAMVVMSMTGGGEEEQGGGGGGKKSK